MLSQVRRDERASLTSRNACAVSRRTRSANKIVWKALAKSKALVHRYSICRQNCEGKSNVNEETLHGGRAKTSAV